MIYKCDICNYETRDFGNHLIPVRMIPVRMIPVRMIPVRMIILRMIQFNINIFIYMHINENINS